MYFISQCGKEDCAFACLTMLLANYHHDKNYLFLKHEDRRYNFRELIGVAKTYNTNLIGIKVTDTNELLNCEKEKLPFIAILKPKALPPHSVLVLSINKKKVTIYDPQFGKRKIDFSLFVERWTKVCLILKSFEKTKCDSRPISFIKKKDKIILSIIQVIGSLCLLAGTFFIDKSSLFYIPIILFSLFIVFEILFRKMLVKTMKKVDQSIFHHKFKCSRDEYKDVFETIQQFKVSSISILPELLCSTLIAIFIAIILIMNNVWNSLYVVCVIMLAFLEHFIFVPHFNDKEGKIIELENQVYSANGEYEFTYFAQKSSRDSYKLATYKAIFKYAEIAVLLILSIAIMYLSNLANVTYIVFYLCINIFMITTLNKLFEYAKARDNLDALKAKLINYLK